MRAHVTFSVPPNCLSPGDKHFSHTGEGGGQTFLTHREGQTFFHTGGGGYKHFSHMRGGDKHFYTERWGQTFYIGDVGGDGDVDGEEEDVSKANIPVSEAGKLSAGARIFRGL